MDLGPCTRDAQCPLLRRGITTRSHCNKSKPKHRSHLSRATRAGQPQDQIYRLSPPVQIHTCRLQAEPPRSALPELDPLSPPLPLSTDRFVRHQDLLSSPTPLLNARGRLPRVELLAASALRLFQLAGAPI